jgi:hypothetical protein
MQQKQRTAPSKISLAVQNKFIILLLLTLALMFDVINRQPNSDLFNNYSVPETPALR